MMYVDENLCTGCGLCLDACPNGAVSLRDYRATIDLHLCASCGRCEAVCFTGAIGPVEVVPTDPPFAVPGSPSMHLPWPGAAPSLPIVQPALGVARTDIPAPSPPPTGYGGALRLETLEKVVSGIFALVNLALERKKQPAFGAWSNPGRDRSRTGRGAGAPGAGLGLGAGGDRGRGSSRTGLRLGRQPGRGGGEGPGRGPGRGGGEGLGLGRRQKRRRDWR